MLKMGGPSVKRNPHKVAHYYQRDAVRAVEGSWILDDWKRSLMVIPTGGGKTMCTGELCARAIEQGGRTLFLAHTKELASKPKNDFEDDFGCRATIEMADQKADDSPMVFASVQTMANRIKSGKWRPDTFQRIILDESHRALAAGHKMVTEYFGKEGALICGCTATPRRGDKKDLLQFFDGIAYDKPIQELFLEGFLIEPTIQHEPLGIVVKQDKPSDFSDEEVGEAIEPYLDEAAERVMKYAKGRCGLSFLPLRKTARMFRDKLKDRGLKCEYVGGDVDPKEQAKIKRALEMGEIDHVANAMLWCLDEKTDILTSRGFLPMGELKHDDLVANWKDGEVFFEKPKGIISRETIQGEEMVSCDSRMINFRVTGDHDMVIGSGGGRNVWKKIKAKSLARNVMPACGVAPPLDISVDQPTELGAYRRNHKVASLAYSLRQKRVMDRDASLVEAKRRVNLRSSLRRKNPKELTKDECRFIGFWIADGNVTKLRRGGLEYSACQSIGYPRIIKWFDEIISKIGVHSLRKIEKRTDRDIGNAKDRVIWSFCRGTGGGSQERVGLFHLEPYLQKMGTPLFWGLNETQFDALVEGYWMGDGFHGQAENGMPNSIHMADTKKPWIELLQAIGSVRGWRCDMGFIPRAKPHHSDQWSLTMVKGADRHISTRTIISHSKPKNGEKVWCVRSSSGMIITRRGGKVLVTGNSEGVDIRPLNLLVDLRPSCSWPSAMQKWGRMTRTWDPDAPYAKAWKGTRWGKKTDGILMDFCFESERHSLVQRPAVMVAKDEEEEKLITKALQKKGGGNLMDALKSATNEREETLRKRLEAMRHREARTVSALDYFLRQRRMDLVDYEPHAKWEMEPVTEEQSKVLVQAGIDVSSLQGKGHAVKVLDVVVDRIKKGMATTAQCRYMEDLGHPSPWEVTFQEASRWLDENAKRKRR